MKRLIAYGELAGLAGTDLGASSWHRIGQEHIDRFADATGDRQWIHIDVERATREMGGTIAHGFLTLSILPVLSAETLEFAGISRGINYGFDRLRFTGMVRAGSRIRLAQLVTKSEEKAGGVAFTRDIKVEIENEPRPALIAEWIVLLFP
jgi:acyl dehydratase